MRKILPTIHLRPHHGLCFQYFEGKGYSDGFVENMARIKDLLEQNPTVEIVEDMDDVCAACPNNKGGICTSQEKVLRYDAQVLTRCNLSPNAVITYQDLSALITEKIIAPNNRCQVCGDCGWSDICR